MAMAFEKELEEFSRKTEFCNQNSKTFDPFSNKLIDESSETDSDQNHISTLGFITDQVKNMQNHPFIHISSISSEGKDVSAVDDSRNCHHYAYSFHHSNEIHLVAKKCLSDNIARNDFISTWLNFSSAKNQLTSVGNCKQRNAECLSSPQLFTIEHDDVSGLRFSSDDNLLLSCSSNGSIKVMSTVACHVLDCFNSYGSCTDIDVNTDTTQFVTANLISSNPFHVACLYSFERKYPVQYFSGHENSVKCVRFHPNGSYIATASSDKSIKLWSVHQSKEVRNFSDNDGMHPEKVIFSPDGKHIASTHGKCVKIWDISSGKKVRCLETVNPEPCTLNVCYNLDGGILAAGGSDKKVHIWNLMSASSSEIIPDCDLLRSEYLGKNNSFYKICCKLFLLCRWMNVK